MAIDSETGSAELPDIGTLAYNGVTFSQLYTSVVSGEAVPDAAGWTVKYMRYTITVDGLVTIEDQLFANTIDATFANLRIKLSAQGGELSYTGKGFGNPFIVNKPGGNLKDVAWGPIPKVLEFIPQGGSSSAKIKWQVTVCIPEVNSYPFGGPTLQFTNETSVKYDNSGYSSITIKGALEIALTRATQQTRTMTRTVDTYRDIFLNQIANDFDFTRYRVTNRTINISADKRLMDWNFELEELPYMGPPCGMLTAGGTFTMKPMANSKVLSATVQWICTMSATYTVPKNLPRRIAWLAFMGLWNFRMHQSRYGNLTFDPTIVPDPNQFNVVDNAARDRANAAALTINNATMMPTYNSLIRALALTFAPLGNKAMPLSLSVTEGLYDDSKTVSFEAAWRLNTHFQFLFNASGIWRKTGLEGGNLWARSVRSISGASSWLEDKLDPAGQLIVDFGSPL